MAIVPEQMDPMDSFLVMLVVISIASGMPHPDTVEVTIKGFFRFVYGWIYGSAQALCQNAGKVNPSLGNLTIPKTIVVANPDAPKPARPLAPIDTTEA